MRRFLGGVFTAACIIFPLATNAQQPPCAHVLQNAPRNATEVTDRGRQLLKYGRTICSSEWRSFSDARQSKQDLSLSLLEELGLTSNDTAARQTFEEWKRTHCDQTNLKQSIYNDLVSKQSYVSDLVYRAYEACIIHSSSQNAMTCSYVPANSDGDGFLLVMFRPNRDETSASLADPIVLQNGVWTILTPHSPTLPAGHPITLRENYFPIKRTDLTKGEFLRVSLRNYPGQCAVDIPPWPTFTATLKLRVYYTQKATGRTANFSVEWTGNSGRGPIWICVDQKQAGNALSWNEGAFDYRISDHIFSLTGTTFPSFGTVDLDYYSLDKTCGHFAAKALAKGAYSFLVTGTRRTVVAEPTKVLSSKGEPLFFKIEDWKLPQDAAPGSKLTFDYSLQISERRGSTSSPVISLSTDEPSNGRYKSSIDSAGIVTLAYE